MILFRYRYWQKQIGILERLPLIHCSSTFYVTYFDGQEYSYYLGQSWSSRQREVYTAVGRYYLTEYDDSTGDTQCAGVLELRLSNNITPYRNVRWVDLIKLQLCPEISWVMWYLLVYNETIKLYTRRVPFVYMRKHVVYLCWN